MPDNLKINGNFWLYLLLILVLNTDGYSQPPAITPGSERLKSIMEKREMVKRSTITATFRNIGPTAMSGRVVDLDVNPEKPIEFYVAYASGGLWYTNNNGQSFTPVMDSVDVLNLGDVTVHWPSGTIWVGTGEANASRSTYSGMGVYKSTDKGKTWQYMGLPESHHIGKILIDPLNPETVWVAVTGHLYTPNEERGIYKTTDGGKTWKRVLYVNNLTGGIDMDLNPQNPDELYACMWQKERRAWNFEENGAGSGIFKTTDGGVNWQKVNVDGSGLPAGDSLGRCGISLFAANPQVVYLLVDNQGMVSFPERKDTIANKPKYQVSDFRKITLEEFATLDESKLDSFLRDNRMAPRYNAKTVKEWVATGKIKPNALYLYIMGDEGGQGQPRGSQLYRSEDGGKTWIKSTDRTINTLYATIGYYFGRVAVSPTNDKKLIALGLQPMLSTDGGKSFKIISKTNTHADFHALWINPKNDDHIIVGNDGGVNITYDNGANWYHANSPAVGQHYSVSVDNSKPYRVFTGFQDNGVWYGPSQSSTTNIDFADPKGFRKVAGGDGMMAVVDPRDNKTIYLGMQFGTYHRTHLDTGGYLSLKPIAELGNDPFRFNWLSPILLSRHLPDVFYIGSNKVHQSLDKGRNLQTISPDLTNGKKPGNVPYGTITALDESPMRFGLLYAGTDDGKLHVSKDFGNWKPIYAKLPKGLWVSRVVASGYKESRVFVTLSGYREDHFSPYVFMSDDYGENWKPIHKGLPLECVNVIREDPWADSVLYVGTDGGLYVSKNYGATWQIWQKGLPFSVPVYDIAIHKAQNEIVLATHGRSLYVASLNSINGVKGEVITPAPRRQTEEGED